MNENTHSEWRVMKNYIGDEYMYAVYRLRDISRTDHTGNREMGSEYMLDKQQAEKIASDLNLAAQGVLPAVWHSANIKVAGHKGTWYITDNTEIQGVEYLLLEHEDYGDTAASIITTTSGELVLDDVWNGFDDLVKHLENHEEMDCPE